MIGLVRELAAEVHAQDRTPPAPTLASTLDRDLGLDSMARVELLLRVGKFDLRRWPHIGAFAVGFVLMAFLLARQLGRLRGGLL